MRGEPGGEFAALAGAERVTTEGGKCAKYGGVGRVCALPLLPSYVEAVAPPGAAEGGASHRVRKERGVGQ